MSLRIETFTTKAGATQQRMIDDDYEYIDINAQAIAREVSCMECGGYSSGRRLCRMCALDAEDGGICVGHHNEDGRRFDNEI